MKKATGKVVLLAALFSFVIAAQAWAAQNEPFARVEKSTALVDRMMKAPGEYVPPDVLRNAVGIAILPDVIQAGLGIGGLHGNGVFLEKRDGGWSAPVFVSLTGGTLGLQIGAESSDMVLIFRDRKAVDDLLKGQFTFGAGVSAIEGPEGSIETRSAEKGTSTRPADIYSYRFDKKGLLAAADVSGSVLSTDTAADATFYGKSEIAPKEIFEGKDLQVPAVAKTLRHAMSAYSAAAGSTGSAAGAMGVTLSARESI